MKRILSVFAILMLSVAAKADWTLDNTASTLSFISVKNASVVETHTFGILSGSVEQSGRSSIQVALESVNTSIPLRDERMRNMLFEVAEFPVAKFETNISMPKITSLPPGRTYSYDLKGTMTIHGKSADVEVPVTVVNAGEGTFVVTSQKALLLSAESFGLSGGIEALQNVAGLSSITPTVPITFTLVFREKPGASGS